MMKKANGRCRFRLFSTHGLRVRLVGGLWVAAAIAAITTKSADAADKKAIERPPANIKVPAAEVAALKAFKAKAWSVPGAEI